MNIIEMEDMLKGMPDDQLQGQMQSPGQIPGYLVLSEIQRRQDMRQRAQEGISPSQQTVAEQIMQQEQRNPPTAPGAIPTDPFAGRMGLAQRNNQPVQKFQEGGLTSYLSPRMRQLGQTPRTVSGNTTGREILLGLGRSMNLIAPVDYERGMLEERLRGVPSVYNVEQPFVDRSQFLGGLEGAGPVSVPVGFQNPVDSFAEPGVGNVGVVSQNALQQDAANAGVVPAGLGLEPGIMPAEAESAIANARNAASEQSAFTASLMDMPALTSPEEKRALVQERLGYDFPTDTVDVSDIIQRQQARADRLRQEADERMGLIKREAKGDALAQALIQLGAGVAGNDMAGGLARAGEAVMGIQGEARDRVLEEQRTSDQLEEAARSTADSLVIQERKEKVDTDRAMFMFEMENVALDSAFEQQQYNSARQNLLDLMKLELEDKNMRMGGEMSIAEVFLRAKQLVEERRLSEQVSARTMVQAVEDAMTNYGYIPDDETRHRIRNWLIQTIGAQLNVPINPETMFMPVAGGMTQPGQAPAAAGASAAQFD